MSGNRRYVGPQEGSHRRAHIGSHGPYTKNSLSKRGIPGKTLDKGLTWVSVPRAAGPAGTIRERGTLR